MFDGVNKVILVGNLGSDPEIVKLANGKIFVKINVATTFSWKNITTQEWNKRTEWHQVILHNRLVSLTEKYLKKGVKVYVEGFLKTDKIEKNNSVSFSTKIICNNILLLSDKHMSKGEVEDAAFSYSPEESINNIENEEDIPF